LLRWATVWPCIIDMGQKFGLLCPFGGRSWSTSNTMWPGPRRTSVPSGILVHLAIWPQQTWVKIGGCAPFGGAGSPSNIKWPGPRPTSIPTTKWQPNPSNSLATVHQRHRGTDRQTGQTDNGVIAQGEAFYKRSPKNGRVH